MHKLQLQPIILVWLVLAVGDLASYISASQIALPLCPDHCGDVKIPYPFGIGPNCYYDAAYEIICINSTSHHPKPFLGNFNFEVLDIRWQNGTNSGNQQILKVRTTAVGFCSKDDVNMVDLGGSPYLWSRSLNVMIVKNCGGSVVLKNRNGTILTGCASYCSADDTNKTTSSTQCYGIGCCQASLLPHPTDSFLDISGTLDFYQIDLDHRASVAATHSNNTCDLTAALIDIGSIQHFAQTSSRLSLIPTVLEWNAPNLITSNYQDYFFDNVTCEYTTFSKMQCSCGFYYEGNPYIPNGCQAVRQCQKCGGRRCAQTETGSFYCEKHHVFNRASAIGFSIGLGVVLLIIGCYWLYRLVKWRKERRQKEGYFKKNGGLLLQQQMSSDDGIVEKTKIFSVTELETATDNFNKDRILGQGGQGTVYKGMLTDGRTVAIKKSKMVDENQLEQFINEVVILSQINHRNVVEVLGCCLETEVPLLVYEFLPHGTLYQHIHDPNEEFQLTWKMRLQVAAESAGALAYLHSSLSAPIYHRDIKSSNILLDDKYRAKVSDFGTSRAIAIEQTHVTTCVQGTYGYLDPEYFQSNQFSEKSDVYSFGVVLVELITGRKPIFHTESGGWMNLATEFLTQMENCTLFDILDARVSEEGKKQEVTAVAHLAKQCLNMNGKQRPRMKEVAMLLDEIRSAPQVPDLKEPISAKKDLEIMEVIEVYSDRFSTNPSTSNSDSWQVLLH